VANVVEQWERELKARLDQRQVEFQKRCEQRERELNSQLDAEKAESRTLADKLADRRSAEQHSFIRLCVATIVFIAGVFVLFVLILNGVEPNVYSFGVFASLVASGGYMFFGSWISAAKKTDA
jgi:hypothetical protein